MTYFMEEDLIEDQQDTVIQIGLAIQTLGVQQPVSDAASEGIWLNRLYAELTLKPHKPLLIYIDSTGSMSLAHNPRHHDRTKHIDVRHHFIREAIDNGHVELQHVNSEENTADALTKQLPQPPHELHRASMGVVSFKSSEF